MLRVINNCYFYKCYFILFDVAVMLSMINDADDMIVELPALFTARSHNWPVTLSNLLADHTTYALA